MTVRLKGVGMCCNCGLHSDITIECEHESQIVPLETEYRGSCVYCKIKGRHVVTELKEVVNAKETVIFT